MPSTPGRSLVAHHRTQRRFYVVRITDRLHQIACSRRAFGFGHRRDHFDLSHVRREASPRPGIGKSSISWDWRSLCGHETPELLALSFNPFSGTVRAFSLRSGLLRPLLTSAPRSGGLAAASVRRHCLRTRRRSPGVSPASFPAHPPDLQSRPLMDMDFATSCPLVRPLLPRIRLLFVGSQVRSTLPSDGPSRFRPCASLVLHLHQVAQGTFTPRTLGMPSTQDARHGARRGAVSSLDRSCAPLPWRAVGTKGVPAFDLPPAGRTKG